MRRANEVRRDIIRWLWHVVRLPIVMFLVILEPVVALTCGALALLGVLTTIFFKLIAAPHFPTWTMPKLPPKQPAGSLNMSHSEGLVIVAVTLDCCVGVDTEFIRPIEDIDSLAQRFFTTSEQALVQAAPVDRKEHVFYRYWTRKEAYIKAIGKGFSIPLDSFDSSLALGAQGRWPQTTNDSLADNTWWLSDLALLEGYVGALVVEGRVPKITYVTWSPNGASVSG